jgi:hypothetical protein
MILAAESDKVLVPCHRVYSESTAVDARHSESGKSDSRFPFPVTAPFLGETGVPPGRFPIRRNRDFTVRQLHPPGGSAPLCIVGSLKTVSSSEFEPFKLHVISWLDFYKAWVVQLHNVRTLNTPFKLLVSTSSHVQVTRRCSDRPA